LIDPFGDLAALQIKVKALRRDGIGHVYCPCFENCCACRCIAAAELQFPPPTFFSAPILPARASLDARKRAGPRWALANNIPILNSARTMTKANALELLPPNSGVVLDNDAIEIGELYRNARTSIVDSVKYLIEAGLRLTAKKKSMDHGEWLPWLAANEAELGFKERAARLLMKGAETNRQLATDLEVPEALQLSRTLWGHDRHRRERVVYAGGIYRTGAHGARRHRSRSGEQR
jgi:hypothetical protein